MQEKWARKAPLELERVYVPFSWEEGGSFGSERLNICIGKCSKQQSDTALQQRLYVTLVAEVRQRRDHSLVLVAALGFIFVGQSEPGYSKTLRNRRRFCKNHKMLQSGRRV